MTAAAKDRWHQLADAMQDSNLPASDKHVFRFLLDVADYGTAELPAKFTPIREVICRKTSLSRTQLFYSTRHLERHGWLSAEGPTGPGKPLKYSLAFGRDCDCTGRVHTSERCQPHGATVSTFGTRTVSTNGVNAAGQSMVSTERLREGKVEEEKPEPELVIPGDGNGPADRESFGDWLALISGRAVAR